MRLTHRPGPGSSLSGHDYLNAISALVAPLRAMQSCVGVGWHDLDRTHTATAQEIFRLNKSWRPQYFVLFATCTEIMRRRLIRGYRLTDFDFLPALLVRYVKEG